jgi:hypothetical protein
VQKILSFSVHTIDSSNISTRFTLLTDSFSEGSKVTCSRAKESKREYISEILTLDPPHDIRLTLKSITHKPIQDDIKNWADKCFINE